MSNGWIVVVLAVAAASGDLAEAGHERQTRGLADDMGKMWRNVFTGFDQIQEATMRQVRYQEPLLQLRFTMPRVA
jgi:hypothetical protein